MCIDLHISQWVIKAGTPEGYHQHHWYRHNKPWQNLIFLSPRPHSRIATQWDLPNSRRGLLCIDLHISQCAFKAGSLEGDHQHHQNRQNKPWQNYIFVSPWPNSRISTQWDLRNSSSAQVFIDLRISQWVFKAGTLEWDHQHHRYRHNKPWQNSKFISPRPNSRNVSQWDLPYSRRGLLCIDLHISLCVCKAGTLEGYHQHHRYRHNKPWQNLIFYLQGQTQELQLNGSLQAVVVGFCALTCT